MATRDYEDLGRRHDAADVVVGDDWWRSAFGGLHLAGKTVATAFGGGKLAEMAEGLETQGGLLPEWAQTAPAATPSSAAIPPSAAGPMPTAPQPMPATAPAAPTAPVPPVEPSWSFSKPDYVVLVLKGEKKGRILSADSVSDSRFESEYSAGFARYSDACCNGDVVF